MLLWASVIHAQDMAAYTGSWHGKIDDAKTFSLKVTIKGFGTDKATFIVANSNTILSQVFNGSNTKKINLALAEQLTFKGMLTKDGMAISGFIQSGMLMYHVTLSKSQGRTYSGHWHILMVDELKSQALYLSVENGSGNQYQAFPFLGDNRFTGTWCGNFQKEGEFINFVDYKTGMLFKGKLGNNGIILGMYLGSHLVTQLDMVKDTSEWKIGGFSSDNNVSVIQLTAMEEHIAQDSVAHTHAVIISRHGKLVYEHYFEGYNAAIPHDMRSASKSISSAIAGIAKDQSLYKNVDQSIFDFLPLEYQVQKDSSKAKIDIKSLLTMSSGLDAVDFGDHANEQSPATEDNYQQSVDWLKSILSASMIAKPNTKANYGSANPFLLGIAMDSVVTEPLELYMDKQLFQPLAISDYIIQTDMKGKPYFGGGMYLTPRDMLKFGALYLNGGSWKSKRIISKKWVEASFRNYRPLENTGDKNGYGYLWWHHMYHVKGQLVRSIEARGAGGQYIFVLPSLKAVVVITSGNFRNGKTQQPEKIFEKYILPYL